MTLSSLRRLAGELPFHLDDNAAANVVFRRWHQHRTPADKRLVDLWTYCFVYRYFLIKLAATSRPAPLCFDALVAEAFADVQQHLHGLRHPERYTGWVGTICRHTFVNYLRTRHPMVSFEDEAPEPLVEDTSPTQAHDDAIVNGSLCAAIDGLPAFLREITRMRLLENCSYDAISRHTGKPLATLRTYVHRALGQLRRDARLQLIHAELQD